MSNHTEEDVAWEVVVGFAYYLGDHKEWDSVTVTVQAPGDCAEGELLEAARCGQKFTGDLDIAAYFLLSANQVEPEDEEEPEGDDLCDHCYCSDKVIERTCAVCGGTLCNDCDECTDYSETEDKDEDD